MRHTNPNTDKKDKITIVHKLSKKIINIKNRKKKQTNIKQIVQDIRKDALSIQSAQPGS